MKHAVVFVDHHDARIYFPDGTSAEPEGHETSPRPPRTNDGKRPALDRAAVDAICVRVQNAEEILLIGPGTAKSELVNWLAEHHPDVSRRVVGVETVDHPTPGQIKDLARAAFRHIDAFR